MKAADAADYRRGSATSFATVVMHLLLMLTLAVLAGCASKGPMPTFAASSLPPMSESGETIAPERWWTTFDDDGLDREVNLALGQNFDLAVALSRLRAAQAVTRIAASDWCWDVNGFSESSRTFGPGRDSSQMTWGLDASYQVDLWGQIRSRVDAERFRTSATRSDYQAVALSLSAEVARTWYSLIESYAQLKLLDEQVETNREGLKAVELRYAEVGEGGPNVLRQQQLVQATLEQMVVVRAGIEVLEHQLAVLTGQPPQIARYEPGDTLPELPPMPFAGLPADLLNRRPDVRAAYFALAAADRDVAAAVSDQYPRLNLGASIVNSAQNPETLFRDWFLSLGGQLIGPIIDGGQRRAEVARTRAVVWQRFSEYRQTTLIALQEVEDALALERRQIERIQLLEAQFKSAELASQQLLQYFITGNTSYLDVLSTVQSRQSLQRSILSARLDLIQIRIGLYLALAGAFDTRPIENNGLLLDAPQLTSERDSDAGELLPPPAGMPVDVSPAPTELPSPAAGSGTVKPAKEFDLNE
ncbi:TolC family protein [Rosistilla carotiformis]|uniref:TolC family protein n=1 Tax=Rosistilla carotiformis TaxID=2528017 RepID=UPI0018D262A6|nr:efflux transporter outer membrane subunit [Rosistilla carotiformis]